MANETVQKFKRKLTGTVVSDVNDQTIVVNVVRRFKHRTYSKFINQSKKYHAHDVKNTAKKGDVVTIIESKPYSKLKKWELFSVN
ncbi:MAG: 30S ribosomal protein S17 [Bacteriovoracaceae bacterium]